LQFAGATIPDDLDQYGRVFDTKAPRAKLEVDRSRIPEILTSVLSRYSIEDVSVQERPLEEVIAELFTSHREEAEEESATS